jgi:hypothetical protein
MIQNRKKLYELFETKWLMMRQNPSGKSTYLQGFLLGFAGTVNIESALNQSKGLIKIKIGSGEVQSRLVDFTDMLPGELTPSKAEEALTAALFDDCKFSVDAETSRLKLSPTDNKVRFIQIYGDLAAALHFGDCRFNEGKGCYILPSFDGDLKSVEETEQWDEDTVIENDSPRGAPVKHTTPGRRSGTQFAIIDRLDSRAAKQMLNGGTWISGTLDSPDVYNPPTATSGGSHRVDVFTYSEVFEKNNNVEGDEAIIRERLYIGCVGRKTRTGGAGAWKEGEYSLTAPDYIGDDGKEHASPRESDYSKAQWDILKMDNIVVRDWENA